MSIIAKTSAAKMIRGLAEDIRDAKLVLVSDKYLELFEIDTMIVSPLARADRDDLVNVRAGVIFHKPSDPDSEISSMLGNKDLVSGLIVYILRKELFRRESLIVDETPIGGSIEDLYDTPAKNALALKKGRPSIFASITFAAVNWRQVLEGKDK